MFLNNVREDRIGRQGEVSQEVLTTRSARTCTQSQGSTDGLGRNGSRNNRRDERTVSASGKNADEALN